MRSGEPRKPAYSRAAALVVQSKRFQACSVLWQGAAAWKLAAKAGEAVCHGCSTGAIDAG